MVGAMPSSGRASVNLAAASFRNFVTLADAWSGLPLSWSIPVTDKVNGGWAVVVTICSRMTLLSFFT